ncbi:MAG TPA: DUF2934 domain-containing protein [Nitrospiraceae bacterium]
MNAQVTKRAKEKQPHTTMAGLPVAAVARGESARGPQPSFDDLYARIAVRAYELYVERGCRYGGALEDWLDAEREVLANLP